MPNGAPMRRRRGRQEFPGWGVCLGPEELRREYNSCILKAMDKLLFDARPIVTWHPRLIEATQKRLLKRCRIDGDCWLWEGPVVKGQYGEINALGQHWLVHRLAYALWKGRIPEGLVVDHLCNRPLCFNPDHLEAVLPFTNYVRSNCKGAINLRTGFCKRGHPWIPENIGNMGNHHYCRPCRTEWRRLRPI